MTKKEFARFWSKKYPQIKPLNLLFGKALHNSWLRIHSLPESKRYADSEDEWEILYSRQNTIINDLIPTDANIQLVINWIDKKHYLFQMYKLIDIGTILEDEIKYKSYLFETKWQTNKLNIFLNQIAEDQIRAFIIGNDCLISPYDGGVDIYYKDTETRDFYKLKYKEWLSKREDGL
jgi:hypothetical protein